jgi:hypothetical protein
VLRRLRPFHAVLLITVASGLATPALGNDAGSELFEKKIRPVLVERCYECHSANAKKVKGGLLLDTRAGLRKGGDSGPAIVPGKPDESLLIKAIGYHDDKLEMPPKNRLSDDEVAAFVEWVKLGAPDPREGTPPGPKLELVEATKFWSFQPVQRPSLPDVSDKQWPQTPIDHFILSELQKRRLKPAPAADRRTLIRRASYDLIGLPPSPEEVEEFTKDAAPLPEAFAKVVDRLLASSHYGERWGRHWMDVVRYADTAGDNSDYPVPELYRYRNYVIDAFNSDKPYDEFVREQIAGDLLPAKEQSKKNEQIIATGYIALSRRFGSIVDNYPQHLTIEDTIDNLGRTFLGLSISCARCHDHKFDAISKEDYYGLYGIFQSTKYPFPGIELDKKPRDFVPLLEPEKYKALMDPYQKRLAEIEASVAKLKEERKQAVEKKDEKRAAELAQAVKTAGDERSKVPPPRVDMAYAVSDAKPAHAKVHKQGDPKSPGDEVPRRFLQVLGGQTLSAEDAKTSGRRQLADWIAQTNNPLTARVIANRIWHYHFGSGLVATPNDFGVRGQPPTHPQLLDWLAGRFVADGWSIKKMHRLIMTSRVYQLSSADDEQNLAQDPENQFHWRFNRRRLDAEQFRDAVMLLAGTLDLSPLKKPHPFPPVEKWDFTQHYPFKDVYPTTRRSVYIMNKRLTALPYFQTFDGADPNATTAERDSSVTTVQALYLLNDDFIHEQAGKFARRLLRERAEDAARIDHAFELVLGRGPTTSERERSLRFIEQARARVQPAKAQDPEIRVWTSFAAVLLRINEFLYVD